MYVPPQRVREASVECQAAPGPSGTARGNPNPQILPVVAAAVNC